MCYESNISLEPKFTDNDIQPQHILEMQNMSTVMRVSFKKKNHKLHDYHPQPIDKNAN